MSEFLSVLIKIITVVFYLTIMPIGFMVQNLIIILSSIRYSIDSGTDVIYEIAGNYAISFEENAKFIKAVIEDEEESE